MEITATAASASERAGMDRWAAEIQARQSEQVQALSAISPVTAVLPGAANKTEVSPTEPSLDAAVASARAESERKPPMVNADGQLVGTRVNTTA